MGDLGNELRSLIVDRIDQDRIGYATHDLFVGLQHGLCIAAGRQP